MNDTSEEESAIIGTGPVLLEAAEEHGNEATKALAEIFRAHGLGEEAMQAVLEALGSRPISLTPTETLRRRIAKEKARSLLKEGASLEEADKAAGGEISRRTLRRLKEEVT